MLTEVEQHCKYHPDRIAKRHCFQCGDYVCAECQQVALHHVFCSGSCKRRYVLRQAVRGLFRAVATVPGLAFGSRSPLRRLGFRGLFDLVLLAGLAACLLVIMRVHYSTGDLKRRLAGLSGQSHLSAVTDFEAEEVRIAKPSPGAMVLVNRIDIEGESGNNQIISLSSDGRLLAVAMTERGKFRFSDVRAKRGLNRFVVRAISEDGSVHTLETIEFYYGLPPLDYLARSFDRGSSQHKSVAITFDGGSINNVTDEILDALRERGMRCTMFLTAGFIRHYPQTVRKMVADGHEIGNHTWSHPHLTTFAENRRHLTRPGITREFLQRELESTAELFRSVTKKEMAKLWRAPYGEHNREIRRWAAEIGYRQVGWTLGRDWEHSMDTLDWVADKNSAAYYSSEEILEKIVNFGNGDPRGANGAIILMHLGTQRTEDQPHRMVPEIIGRMQAKGYSLVTISEMM